MGRGSQSNEPDSQSTTLVRGHPEQPGGRKSRPFTMLLLGMVLGVAALGLTIVLLRLGPVGKTAGDEKASASTQNSKAEKVQLDEAVDTGRRLDVLPGVRSVAPQTPWLKPDASLTLTRIGVGLSLIHISEPTRR